MRFVLLDSSAGPVPSSPTTKTPYLQQYEKCSIILLQIPSHTSRARCMLSLWYGDPIRIIANMGLWFLVMRVQECYWPMNNHANLYSYSDERFWRSHHETLQYVSKFILLWKVKIILKSPNVKGVQFGLD